MNYSQLVRTTPIKAVAFAVVAVAVWTLVAVEVLTAVASKGL